MIENLIQLLSSDDVNAVQMGVNLAKKLPGVYQEVSVAKHWLTYRKKAIDGYSYRFVFDGEEMEGVHDSGIRHPGGDSRHSISGFVVDGEDYPFDPDDCESWEMLRD